MKLVVAPVMLMPYKQVRHNHNARKNLIDDDTEELGNSILHLLGLPVLGLL